MSLVRPATLCYPPLSSCDVCALSRSLLTRHACTYVDVSRLLELATPPRRPLEAISQARTDRAPMVPWSFPATVGRPREPWGKGHGIQSPWVGRPVEVQDGDEPVILGEGQTRVYRGQQWHSKNAPSRMKTFYYVDKPPSKRRLRTCSWGRPQRGRLPHDALASSGRPRW